LLFVGLCSKIRLLFRWTTWPMLVCVGPKRLIFASPLLTQV
jgi:hypothetical protein